MAKKTKEKKSTHPEATALFFISFAVILFFALFSFSFLHPKENWLGYIGYILALGSEYLFGLGSYLIPLYFFGLGVRLINQRASKPSSSDHLYFACLLGSICMLLTVFADSYPKYASLVDQKVISESITFHLPYTHKIVRYNLGGVPFYFLFSDLSFLSLQKVLSPIGCSLVFSAAALLSFFLLTHIRLSLVIQLIQKIPLSSLYSFLKKQMTKPSKPQPAPIKIFSKITPERPKIRQIEEEKQKQDSIPLPTKPKIIIQSTSKKETAAKAIPTEDFFSKKHLDVQLDPKFKLPPPNLLTNAKHKVDQPTLTKDLMHQASVLEETLKSFGIEAKVGEINSGPTITSFEVHPSIGVKVQKIKALENDIALNMEAKSIRIVAPIPGKAAVGVEVPALHPQEVSFKEMLLHYTQKSKRMQIPILLGKAINGEWVFSDLTKMPHLLIAGATGSGKSVCVNTIVMSILMNARPDEVKLLMVDPKKVELTQYSKLPHMIAPVITEAHGAYAALQWLVKEMQVRYEILKQLGLRNISAFNERKINKELESSLNIPIPQHMPYIVAIIDEFADLMMVSSADLETPIARIAQMARAVGIHLILATQRPSREVITGIIKANIPTRISFKVASRINSQIILDEAGAESLLGNGDLLFLPPGSSSLTRAQGAYISDHDINEVIRFLSTQGEANYLIPSFDAFRPTELLEKTESKSGKDALYDQALSIVLSTKNASTTYLQRKLKIGYARAASLIDELEENGVISPQDGSKPRRVLSEQTSLLPPEDAIENLEE